ncbi:MAG TPA: hypothetical protein VLW85_09030 [Myxococcales bacterium]|nr:hypothetical protein [Myxococcales bacterium]
MEKLLVRLERKFGRHAPEGITAWIVGISGVLYLAVYAKPDVLPYLWLDPAAVLHGELWRVVTFLFAPTGPLSTFGIVLAAFGLMFLYTMGMSLEGLWGSFHFDVFFFLGAILTLLAAFVVGPVPGWYVGAAILLAFATEFPDYEILMMLILPIKVKWLGILTGGLMIWALVSGDMATRAAVAVALGDYLLFSGGALRSRLKGVGRLRGPRRGTQSAFGPAPRKARVCARCGKSDADDPNLEFRVCDCQEKCHGKLTEYCIEHARAH